MFNAIKNKALKAGLRAIGAVYGVFPVGQAMAVLARGAWAPSGNRRPNRNTANLIESQKLMVDEKFDPSAAVREISRALKTAKCSRSALNWRDHARDLRALLAPSCRHRVHRRRPQPRQSNHREEPDCPAKPL